MSHPEVLRPNRTRHASRAILAITALALAYSQASTAAAKPGVEARAARDDDGDINASVDEDDRKRRDVEGAEGSRLRVHVDSEALGGAWSRRDGNGPSRDSLSFGAGLARPSLIDSGAGMFSRPLFGFGLGHVFSRHRAVLGAKLAVSVDGYDIDASTRTVAVGGRLVPYFHWMFLPGHRVRPYGEARVGLGGSATSMDVYTNDEIGRTTGNVVYPIFGVGAGVHFFPRNWFSVDVGLNVDYAAPFGRTTFRDPDRDDTDWNKAADVVNFGLLLGMSSWF